MTEANARPRPPLGERIAVIGSSGAGKSTFARRTFARRLSDTVGIPVVHLDEHYWQPGWVEPGVDLWRAVQRELVEQPRWTMDGNYRRTVGIRLERADTVIMLATGRWRCVWRVLLRVARNHGRAVHAPGRLDRFNLAFLRYVWRYPFATRPRMLASIAPYRNRVSYIELATDTEVEEFLESVAAPGR